MIDRASIAKWVRRNKWTELDGTERERAYVRDTYNLGVDELEALGHEALAVAAEWRKEIAERVPAPPTHKVFEFTGGYYGNSTTTKIASWVEHPWALIRVGNGTAVVFLVKELNNPGTFQAWTVAAKQNLNGTLQWKCRFETMTTVNQRELIHVFPISLPWSPSSGDLEYARLRAAKTQRGAA